MIVYTKDKMIKLTPGWICCAPCVWIRTSTTVHKIALTAATVLVTALLVASPVIFLLSTAPSQLPKDCFTQNDFDCHPTPTPPPECSSSECRMAALSIQARMNWQQDPCLDFKNFSCCTLHRSLKVIKSAQEIVDLQMHQLLAHNTTTGPFRKLGRLYGSCLRHTIKSATIRLILDELGGYLPIGTLGPSKLSSLISKIYKLGPTPLIDLYYEISYGKKPHIMYVIDGPYGSAPIIPNIIRWREPKAPPYCMREDSLNVLDELLDMFLPNGLGIEQKLAEKESIINFIKELLQLCRETIKKDFFGSYIKYNASLINNIFPYFNWDELIPSNWEGPILIKNEDYLKGVQLLLNKHSTRIVHNSLLVLFAISIVPPSSSPPAAKICTKSTIRVMPVVSSALYLAQFSKSIIDEVIERTEIIFEILKAHVKRAPSLKGTALVKLSQLKVKIQPWPVLSNITRIMEILDEVEISSDNWFENVLKIYKIQRTINDGDLNNANHTEWAYPTVAKVFYEPLSHSIVVPLSIILIPYFDVKLPQYLQYATVGVSIAREIFRSITKPFDKKLLNCVPSTINIFSNITNRMDILIYAGGMQIAYHSMLSLTGPLKGMIRLPGINLTPQQIFFLVFAQEFCSDSFYNDGLNINSDDFSDILAWLVSQDGSAIDVFQCPNGSMLSKQKTCTVL